MNSTHSAITMLLTVAAVLTASAQDWSIELPAIVGGGGTATAGVYTVTGTIGQSDASRLHSKDFTIDGGSWGIVAAIQEPGAPRLSVRFTQTNTVVISWPITWPGFDLQENPIPASTSWVSVATPPRIVQTWDKKTEKHVVVPVPTGNRFYRLKKSKPAEEGD